MNWKLIASAVTASLTTLAALPYDLYSGALKQFAETVPSTWKPNIVILGLVCTIGLRIWNGVRPPANGG